VNIINVVFCLPKLNLKIKIMRKFYLFILAALFASSINAQNVTVIGGGSYVNLAAAFAAINAGTHTGDISIVIVNNTSEPVGGAILNASGTGASSYTSISISPNGARTVSGAITAGLPLIDFNGADNVTINSLTFLGYSLTLENTTVSATTGTSTIRFVGGATGNTISNCSIKGAFSGSVATNGGNIFFSTDGITANGNDNNTISFCNIGPSGSNLPTVAICGSGFTLSTANGNSGITINNNNIFDYFGAAVTSAGVATNAGCNTWTISNNRFYQTGIRTWTTGALHTPILINSNTAISGAQGFTITDNVIGYASNIASGTYTLNGSGSFRGIQYNGITGSTVSTISNNTIAAVSLTGVTSSGTSSSSPFMGIYIANGVVISNSNTIGSQSTTGSLMYSTSATAGSDVYGIYNFSSNAWTANNNVIFNITATNTSTGAANVFGLRVNTLSAVATNLSENLINSLQSTAAAATAGTQVVGILVSSSIATITANTIRNLTAPGGTGTSTSSSVAGIVFSSSASNNTVQKNTIFNLSNTNTTTASVVTGIQFNGSAANLVERNLIYDLTVATNSAAAEVNGIKIAGGTTTFRNNIIRLGVGINSAIGAGSATGGVNGFNEPSGTNNFYHNSVYIGGTPTTGLGPSYAFNSSIITNSRVVRDNIFFNARSNSGATGRNYAVSVGGTSANPAGLTINNNVYFANGTGAVFGFFNSTDVSNLAGWQTAVGQDANSISSNPLFVSTTDLHLQAGSPAINVAANVGVTKDFDNKTRPGTNALFDIGADERDGIAQPTNDIQATAFINPTNGGSKGVGVPFSPQASFTNNGSNNQTNVTVRYTILNAGSIQVYNQTFVIPVLNSETSTTVTFPNATLSVAGNYSIIAKAELVGDVVTSNDQITGTFTVIPALSGSYTVGSGGNYASLTNDLGIFDALNNIGVSGNITINIISDLNSETGIFALNENTGGFSVLIRPSGSPRIITGSNASALIKLNDADKVTIDGSINGSVVAPCVVGGDSTLRQLTIQNTNVGTSACVLSISSVVNGATNNLIKNVKILGQSSTTTLLGISVGGATPGNIGLDGDNNRIENCSVKRTLFGIYAAGASAANQNIGTVITQNDLSALSTDRVRRVGIVVFNDNGASVSYNSIGGMDTNESADAIGIGIGTLGVDATNATGGGVNNALVTNNKINGINSNSTIGFSASGIAVAGNSGSANIISNNMITGVISNSTNPDLLAGIFVAGAVGSDTRIYHNSVSMTGNRGTTAAQMPSYGIAITGTDPTVELKNNIFYNIQEPGSGGVDTKTYAIGMVTSTFANLNSNNNNFFTGGTQPGFFRSGSLNVAAGTDYATRALWTTATAKDANSAELLPPFINILTDLHLTAKMVGITGTPLATIKTDFDCQSRATVPEVGADEFGIISIANGLWTLPATWNINRVPISSDVVIIDTPHTVTLNSTGNAKSVLQKGKLTLGNVSALLRLGF
jgi:trimeric autotransporter adhesin